MLRWRIAAPWTKSIYARCQKRKVARDGKSRRQTGIRTDKGDRNHGHRDECKQRVCPLVRKGIVHVLRKEREGRSKNISCPKINQKRSRTSHQMRADFGGAGTYGTWSDLPTQMTHMVRSLTETKGDSHSVVGVIVKWRTSRQGRRRRPGK